VAQVKQAQVLSQLVRSCAAWRSWAHATSHFEAHAADQNS